MDASIDAQRPLVEAFARELAGVVGRITGETVACPVAHSYESARARDWAAWRQDFTPAIAGPAWAVTSGAEANELGRRILDAAGIFDVDDAAARASYLDLIRNAFSTFLRPLAQRVGEPLSCGAGGEDVPSDGPFLAIDLRYGGATTRVLARFEGVPAPEAEPAPERAGMDAAPSPALRPQTLDLLLDVELPVSVSFGSAELPLKDVVKLTAGSIVELDRCLSETVELIVNNCVIARGEVVVVEGDFAVRILEVVSRQERLRTVR